MRRILLILLIVWIHHYPCWAEQVAKKAVKKGNSLYNQGEFSQALKSYEEALVDEPQSDIVNYNLGAALYKTEDYHKSISHFEKALVAEDKSLAQKASYNLGNTKYKYGISFEEKDLSKAISLLEESLRHYEHALKIDPQDEDAKYNYEFVKKELERLRKKLEQKKQQQQKQKEQSQGEQEKEKKQQDRQQQQEQKQKQEEEAKKQDQQKEQAKEQQEQAESASPEEKKKEEQKQASQQTPSGKQPEEMSEQEAKALLENYSQDEEPKGLYKQKMPAFTLPDAEKDW